MSHKMHHTVSCWFEDSSEFFPLQKSPGEVVLLFSFGLNDKVSSRLLTARLTEPSGALTQYR